MLSLCAPSRALSEGSLPACPASTMVRSEKWLGVTGGASPSHLNLHEHKSGACPHGSVTVLRMISAGAACGARPPHERTAPARGALRPHLPMDTWPMRPVQAAHVTAPSGESPRGVSRRYYYPSGRGL